MIKDKNKVVWSAWDTVRGLSKYIDTKLQTWYNSTVICEGQDDSRTKTGLNNVSGL